MQAVGASEKVFEYIDRKPEIAPDSGTYAPDQFSGRIEFRNVFFSYPGRRDTVVLKVVLVFCLALSVLFLWFAEKLIILIKFKTKTD